MGQPRHIVRAIADPESRQTLRLKNEGTGWMHPSMMAPVAREYRSTVSTPLEVDVGPTPVVTQWGRQGQVFVFGPSQLDPNRGGTVQTRCPKIP